MTKKDRQREALLRHGFKLIRVFNLPAGTRPLLLFKAVHRLECEAHRMAENDCNGLLTTEQVDKKEASIMKRLDNLLNFKAQNIPVFFNGDPRGCVVTILRPQDRRDDFSSDGIGVPA